MQENYILIGIDSNYSDSQINSLIATINQIDQSYEYKIYQIGRYKFKEIPLRLESPKNCMEITNLIDKLENNDIVSYVHYTMQTDNCLNPLDESIGNLCINSYGSSSHVKVFDESDLTALNQTISETNTELVAQDEFMPKWFEVRATKKSKGDALKLANYFEETELFEHSEPSISKYPVE